MGEEKSLVELFEANREHLRRVAYRMLGGVAEADDAVQEAWLRLARADAAGIENVRAWLTTVVARICLDILRARKARRETPLETTPEAAGDDDISRHLELADSISLALMVVLETLSPAERVAFVLHDMFSLPFEEIGRLLARSPAAARQLASRARRRVQGSPAEPHAEQQRSREIVEAFLAASQGGDFSSLLALLDPGVVLRADAAALAASLARMGDTPELAQEIRGREAVAKVFHGRARAARVALVEGEPGLVIAFGGVVRMVFDIVIDSGRITDIGMIGDPVEVSRLELSL